MVTSNVSREIQRSNISSHPLGNWLPESTPVLSTRHKKGRRFLERKPFRVKPRWPEQANRSPSPPRGIMHHGALQPHNTGCFRLSRERCRSAATIDTQGESTHGLSRYAPRDGYRTRATGRDFLA